MDITNIKWQRGSYQKFYALMKIRVGAADPKSIPIDIQQGDEFEYDGQLLKYAGSEIHSPQLRGAIKNGWASLDSDGDSSVSPVKAERNIAKSQTINKDLSKVQRSGHNPLDTEVRDEEIILNVSDRRDSKSDPKSRPNIMTHENNRRVSTAGMRVETSEVEAQNAVSVGRVRSPAKINVDLTKNSSINARDIESRGLGQPEMFNEKTIEREGVTIKTNVGKTNRNVQHSDPSAGSVVGKVRHSKTASSDGVEVRDTSDIRSKSNILPVKANTKAAPVEIDTNVSPKVRMARRIYPSFPSDWEFTGKLKDRLAAVVKHGPDPDFLEALYTAEGDQMRAKLEEVYPEQFSKSGR